MEKNVMTPKKLKRSEEVLTRARATKVSVFALSSSVKLATEIVEHLGIELGSCQIVRFADGEVTINIEESVRGKKVFIVQSTASPVNESYMELLIMLDALKRAAASSITVVMPYYGYSRQDRKAKSRQPITAKLVADLIETAGANRVISIDLHASQIQGFFNIPIDNFVGMPTIANYFSNLVKDNVVNKDDLVIVSPDHGGAKRARDLADALNCPIAIIDKRRSVEKTNTVEVMGIIGNVENKVCIMIDDMIDTGGTIVKGADALIANGASKVYVSATHALFSGNAVENLSNSQIEKVIVTNTIELPQEKMFDKLEILSIGKVLSRGMARIVNNKPISDLFMFNGQ